MLHFQVKVTLNIAKMKNMQPELRKVDEFVLGPFDKGTSKLWMACEGYFYPQFYSNFYHAPTHFTEVVRSNSHHHASAELFNVLVSGVSACLADTTVPKPPVPLCTPLLERVEDWLHTSPIWFGPTTNTVKTQIKNTNWYQKCPTSANLSGKNLQTKGPKN